MRNVKYVVAEDYWIKIRDNLFLKIPQGYAYNGCTGVIDACRAASAIHDFTYQNPELTVSDDYGHIHKIKLTRNTKDKIYRDLTSAKTRWIRYFGLVLLGGWFEYKSKPLYFDVSNFEDIPIERCNHKKIECYRRPDSKTNMVWREQFSWYVI